MAAIRYWITSSAVATPYTPVIRRIAIVALARKLLVALWRYLETGLVPRGAVFKA